MNRVRVQDRIGEIAPEVWDRVGRDPFSAHAMLGALEAAGMEGVRLRYAMLENGAGRAVACLPFARLPIDGARLTRGLFRGGIQTVRRLAPSFLRTSLYICGTPLSVGNPPLRIAAGIDPRPVLLEAAGLLNELADEAGAPWRAFKEFGADSVEAARSLAGAGWTVTPSEPNCALRIRWESYREYLEDLRHPYRFKIRKSARKLARAGVDVEVLPLAEGYDPALHRLYDHVFDRAEVQLERLTPGFFQGLGQALGRDARLLRFRREGRTIGWVVLVVHGECVHDLFHGIDYAENPAIDVYFNQLAETVRFAIESGARHLSLGQSTETAKSRFGCEIEPLWIAVRHRDAAVNRLLGLASPVLFPPKEVPRLRVFRTAEDRDEGRERCASASS